MLIGRKKILFIDEAHKVPNIGMVLKRAWDKIKDVDSFIATYKTPFGEIKTGWPLRSRQLCRASQSLSKKAQKCGTV